MKEEVKDVPARDLRKKLKQQEIADTVTSLPRPVKEKEFVHKGRVVKQLRKGRPRKYNVFKKI